MGKITLKVRNKIYVHVYLKTLSDGTITKQAKPYYDGIWNNETFSYVSTTTDDTVRTNVKAYDYSKGWRWTTEILTQASFYTTYGIYPTPKL